MIHYAEPTNPRDLKASPIACNKVNASWKKPQKTGGLPIDIYEIFYKAISSRTLQNKTSTTTSTILDNLPPNTMYTIQVRAKSFIGFSSNTSAKMAMTQSRGE